MTKSTPRLRYKWVLGIVATTALTIGACGTEGPDSADWSGTGSLGDSSSRCGTPNEGCPCDEPGDTVDCGEVKHRSGDYVSCSIGKRQCIGGRWGACIGDQFVTTKAITGDGPLGTIQPAALGTGGPCPTTGPNANPCDPYCNAFIDDDDGITMTTGSGTAQCKAPLDWTAYYAKYSGNNRPNGALPTTCTTGPDKCSLDNKCSAGACTPNAPSASGACTGVDFTLSTPCFDGANMTFMLCNRGTVDATTGILPIAHHNGTASAAASTCTRATNGAAGQCNVNLAVTPLAAGQCRQITPKTDCGIDTGSGDHFFFVNYANTPSVSTTPALAECNTCNNFTATTATAASVAGAACTNVSCGTSLPTGGQYPPSFSSTDGLNTGCAGAFDDTLLGTSCSAAPGPYSNCAQDHHCDAATDRCKWNVIGDWVDSSCAGVDLTIGVGCTDTSGNLHVPVCNRGLGTVPAGQTIQVNVRTSSWSPATACTTNVGSPHCSLTLTQPLVSGACIDIPGCTGQTGERDLVVNPAGTIAECTQCNNWAHFKTTGAGCPVACTEPPPAAVQIYGHSPNRLYRVDPVTLAVTDVGLMSGCGTVFDLAIDASGNMYANSGSDLYKVSYPTTGSGPVVCTDIGNNPTSFNGLTFTPVSLLSPQPAAEPLHGAANNGGWYRINLTNGGAPVTYTLIGYYGGSANKIQSSGDAVGIIGDGEYVVVKSGTTSLPNGDHLWKIDPNTGQKLTDITPTGTGLGACYGIGYWGGKTYLFCGSPQSGIYTIDTINGAVALAKATPGITWNGAAVTTSAPTVPPTPNPPPPATQYYTRDYHAVCAAGFRVVWQFFSWQAVIPTNGSIEFFAQSATSPSTFAPASSAPSATPPAVKVGTANTTTTPPGTWFSDANTVDWHLRNDPPGGQRSEEYLRITMKFNTGNNIVPTLSDWKQTYNCVPVE